ncbi:MAG: rhomboid family intramembrane serine protease [Acidimicrobiales bacterium]
MAESEHTHCYRHTDRRAGVICQRCDRVICPECMNQASVGFHCPECTRTGAQRVIRGPALEFRPRVTQALIGLNVVGMLWGIAMGGSLGRIGFDALVDGSLIAHGVVREGVGVRVIGVDDGEWWRLVSGAFLHDGLLHLGSNMALLWILGTQLERLLGRVRFAAVYTVSLFAGALGGLIDHPTTPGVGASGAVLGLLGMALVAQRASRGSNPWASGVGGLVVLVLLTTFLNPRVSVGGHIGGIIGGILAGLVVVEAIRRRWSDTVSVALLALLGSGFIAASLWAASIWSDPLF